jgi:sulfotransferase family protein
MTLRVVGAGVGRTGTMSLKLALEKLLDAPCYHMLEVFVRPDHVTIWQEAVDGRPPDWEALYEGFVAAVDWPTCTFWRELADAYPDAPVLLSTRDPDDWWRSCDRTIFEVFRAPREGLDEWLAMATGMLERFAPTFLDAGEAKAAFVRHNDEVRATIAPSRLIEWQPGQGWGPLCEGLGLPVPDEPFPHTNTTEEFRSRAGWDA